MCFPLMFSRLPYGVKAIGCSIYPRCLGLRCDFGAKTPTSPRNLSFWGPFNSYLWPTLASTPAIRDGPSHRSISWWSHLLCGSSKSGFTLIYMRVPFAGVHPIHVYVFYSISSSGGLTLSFSTLSKSDWLDHSQCRTLLGLLMVDGPLLSVLLGTAYPPTTNVYFRRPKGHSAVVCI